MSSGIICLQAGTYGSLFHFISSFRIVPVRQEFSPFAWLTGILCLIRFLFLNRYIVCKINYLQNKRKGNYNEKDIIKHRIQITII